MVNYVKHLLHNYFSYFNVQPMLCSNTDVVTSISIYYIVKTADFIIYNRLNSILTHLCLFPCFDKLLYKQTC